jgi:hypothetical protein
VDSQKLRIRPPFGGPLAGFLRRPPLP